MSLKYWILTMFGIKICSGSSAQFCSRRYADGKWISEGDCGGAKMMSEMMKELQRKSKKEKKWTVFQRRIKGDVDFYRNWADYVNGFGRPEGDFWLGLEKLHQMTKYGNMELEINMIRKSDEIRWIAKYSHFSIGPASDNYRLHISGHSGNASEDTPELSNNQQFSTKDADHDDHQYNCASFYEGGWWYDHEKCGRSNLNGNFNKTTHRGIWWRHYVNLIRFSEMKFRKIL